MSLPRSFVKVREQRQAARQQDTATFPFLSPWEAWVLCGLNNSPYACWHYSSGLFDSNHFSNHWGVKNLLNLHRTARLDVHMGLLSSLYKWEHWGLEVRSSWRWWRVEQVGQDSNPSPQDHALWSWPWITQLTLFLTNHITQIGSLPSSSCMKSTEVMSHKHHRHHTDSWTDQGGKTSRAEQW